MKCVVTGGAGFIGSHLVDLLIEKGHEVVSVDNFSAQGSGNRQLNSKAEYLQPNICDLRNDYSHYLRGTEVIFHLAAVSRIMDSFTDLRRTYHTNVVGTSTVVQLAKELNAKLIYAGSSTAEPGAGEQLNDSPYAHSKYVGEQIVLATYNNLRACVCRFFNVYGPRSDTGSPWDSVITCFERQKRQGLPLNITGDGTQKRDFIHVSDLVRGLVAANEKGLPGEIYHLGTGASYSINQVATMFGGDVTLHDARPGERKKTKSEFRGWERLDWFPWITLPVYIKNFNEELASVPMAKEETSKVAS